MVASNIEDDHDHYEMREKDDSEGREQKLWSYWIYKCWQNMLRVETDCIPCNIIWLYQYWFTHIYFNSNVMKKRKIICKKLIKKVFAELKRYTG